MVAAVSRECTGMTSPEGLLVEQVGKLHATYILDWLEVDTAVYLAVGLIICTAAVSDWSVPTSALAARSLQLN